MSNSVTQVQGQINYNPNGPVNHVEGGFVYQGRRSNDQRRQELLGKLNFQTCDSGGGRLVQKVQADPAKILAEKNKWLDLRDAILDAQGIENLDAVRGFNIDFDLQIATYTDPRTGLEVTVDLMHLEGALKLQVKDYFDAADEVIHFRSRAQYTFDGGKGHVHGKPILDRSTNANLQKLPSAFPEFKKVPELITKFQATPDAKRDTINQINYVKKRREDCYNAINQLATTKKDLLKIKQTHQQTDSSARVDVLKLTKEISYLEERKNKLRSMDLYPLSLHIAAYRGELFPEDKKRHAKALGDLVRQEIKESKKFFFGSNELTPVEEAYALDVEGMAFQNRWEYVNHCHGANAPVKQEGFEDIFLRGVLLPGDSKGRDKYIWNEIFRGAPESLKSDIEDSRATLGDYTTPALINQKFNEPVYPQGADATKKQQLLLEQVQKDYQAVFAAR